MERQYRDLLAGVLHGQFIIVVLPTYSAMFISSRSTLLAVGVFISISCGTKNVERTPPPPAWAPGISQNLTRSAKAPSCVLDNIGPVANPAGQKSVEVSGATTFGITGWAIDEANK